MEILVPLPLFMMFHFFFIFSRFGILGLGGVIMILLFYYLSFWGQGDWENRIGMGGCLEFFTSSVYGQLLCPY
jgi:hypothetical protein